MVRSPCKDQMRFVTFAFVSAQLTLAVCGLPAEEANRKTSNSHGALLVLYDLFREAGEKSCSEFINAEKFSLVIEDGMIQAKDVKCQAGDYVKISFFELENVNLMLERRNLSRT